jgi:aromatic-L-amino-acid/L-tryptophan decarboxylase
MQRAEDEHADARPLSLTDSELAVAGNLLSEFLRSYERSLPGRRVMPELDRGQLSGLLDRPFPEFGIGLERLFEEINGIVLPNSTAVAHPRFLAYVLGPPNGIAPYAEAIAATLNQNCNFWQPLQPRVSLREKSSRGSVPFLAIRKVPGAF